MELKIIEVLTGGIVILPMLLIFTLMPYLTRKDICFGIRIPTGKWSDDYLKRLRTLHSVLVAVIGIILLAISTYLVSTLDGVKAEYALIAILIAYLIIYALIYIISWKKTSAYKKNQNWQVENDTVAIADTSKSISTRSINPLWYISYVVIIIATYFASLKWYQSAPDVLPLQYDFNGNVTNAVPKSMSVIYQFIIIQIVMFVIFLGITFLISRAKENYDPNNAKKSAKQYTSMKIRWSKFLFIMGLMLMLLFTFAIYSILNPINPTITMLVPMIFTLLIIVAVIILAVNTGQSGSRINAKDTELSDKINRDDDKYWKLGSLYFNPDDPAIFIEKRFGIGWTNNWAKWQSWLVLLGIIGILIFSVMQSL